MERKKVKREAFDAMWSFLQMGGQESDIQALKEHCELLRKSMMQKTAGQRKGRPNHVPFEDLDAILNVIVIEAMALYLSGDLCKLEEIKNAAD